MNDEAVCRTAPATPGLLITCYGFILSVLASLSGFNFSLNSVTCFTAEGFCSSVLLRFDAIPKTGILFFVLSDSWAFSEGSGLSDFRFVSFNLGPFWLLASESSFNVNWPPFRFMASDPGLAPRRPIPSQTGGFWLLTAQPWTHNGHTWGRPFPGLMGGWGSIVLPPTRPWWRLPVSGYWTVKLS